MEYIWKIHKQRPQETIAKLIEDVGVTRPIASILAQRNITTFDQAKTFFRPEITDLYDPYLMKNMDKAVNRIEKAIAAKENILIYGDYDVDGTTAVALVYEYLIKEYEQIGYYIPDRYAEGYGISYQGIDFAIDNSFSLIIALDCGTKAIEKIGYAKEHGVDFIVCDHHIPGEELPNAILLNPKQNECSYPFQELSGCGIGFKLVQAISLNRGQDIEHLRHLLDLVVVSIGADIVSMTGENRILAHFGLKVLNTSPRIGFKRLIDMAKKTGTLNIMDVVFAIAPRINAAGRIKSGNDAVQLLLAQTMDQVEEISLEINQHNETRKGLDKTITQEALALIQSDTNFSHKKSTVLFKNDWHKGVVGIVASRLIENHYRPTIVLTESNGVAVGSARSIKGFNVYNAIEECADLLSQFGGHNHAAGLTLPLENVTDFQVKFEAVAQKSIKESMLKPVLEIDEQIDFRDIFENQTGGIPKFYRVLKQLAPFGPDNMTPVFVTRQVKDTGQIRLLKDAHLKMNLTQIGYPEITINAIAFNFGHLFNRVKNEAFDIVYTIDENHWNGQTSLQLMIKDIRFLDA
jgi:single-stranded-DNA-specific exonuclease